MEHLFFFPFPVLSGKNIAAIPSNGIRIAACIPWYGQIAGLNPDLFPESIRPPEDMKPGADFPVLFNSYRSLVNELSPGEAASLGKAASIRHDDDSIWNIRSSIRSKDYEQRNTIEKDVYQWHITLLLAVEYERLKHEVNRSFDELSMEAPLADALGPLAELSSADIKVPASPDLTPADRIKKVSEAWYGLFGSHLYGKQYGFILPGPSWLDSLSVLFDGEPERIASAYNWLELFRLPQNTEISEVGWLKGSVVGLINGLFIP